MSCMVEISGTGLPYAAANEQVNKQTNKRFRRSVLEQQQDDNISCSLPDALLRPLVKSSVDHIPKEDHHLATQTREFRHGEECQLLRVWWVTARKGRRTPQALAYLFHLPKHFSHPTIPYHTIPFGSHPCRVRHSLIPSFFIVLLLVLSDVTQHSGHFNKYTPTYRP